MNRDDAYKELRDFGFCYFVDPPSGTTLDEIYNQIEEDISGSRLSENDYWLEIEKALKMILYLSTNNELEELQGYYGFRSSEVKSREFFQQLYSHVKQINIKRKNHSTSKYQ